MYKTKSQEKFIKEVSQKRPDVKVLSRYVSSKDPVTLKCECGWKYEQLADKLLSGQKGCPICGNASNYNQTTETFIERAERIHGDQYDYSKVVYSKGSEKVTIVCPIHGDFEKRPTHHVKLRQGCPKCSTEKRKHQVGWTYSEWEKAGKASSKFMGFLVYKVRCFDLETGEEFIKVGKTFVGVANRFLTIPYDYEVIETTEGSAYFVSELEIKIQQELKNNKYTPNKKFCGMTECFVLDKE